MSAVLTVREYRAACSYAGCWLERERPGLLSPGTPTGSPCAIYLLCSSCPLTGHPRVVYVGKADRRRTGGDVADRLSEHLRSAKAPLVNSVAVIPLRYKTPPAEVGSIEGRIARYFGVPLLCRAVPEGRRRRGARC
jgi:hypothetical protein